MKRKIIQCMLFGFIAVAASQSIAADDGCKKVTINLSGSNSYSISFPSVCVGNKQFKHEKNKTITVTTKADYVTIDYLLGNGASSVDWVNNNYPKIEDGLVITCKDGPIVNKKATSECSYK